MMQAPPSIITKVMIGIILFGTSGLAFSVQWRVSAGMNVSERYSDNDNLSEADEESNIVTVVSPDISLKGSNSGRVDFDVLASLRHSESSDGEDFTSPRLNGDSNVEILDKVLFFDANADINQNRRDPFRATGDDDNSNSRFDNVTTTYNYTLSPYLVGHIKSFADMELRYSHNEQLNSESEVGDSSRETVFFHLNSGRAFSVIDWGLVGNYSKTDHDENDANSDNDDELKSADFRLGYRVNRKLRLRASVGREWNDFESVRSDIDGERWDFGAVWTPNKRTTVDIGYGDRFFGETPTVDISYRRKRSVFTLNYRKELTDARTLRSERSLEDEDPFGELVDPIEDDPIFIFPDEGQIVDERISFSWSRKGKRTTLTLDGDYSMQEGQSTEGDVVFMTSSLDLSRRLSSRLSVDTSVDWENQENAANDEFETWRFNIGLNRSLGSKSNVRLLYTYSDRESDVPGDNYKENRVILTYRISFF
jgi:hypothetical protein